MVTVSPRQRLKDKVRMNQCLELAQLSTCFRRQVACIIVDRQGRILSEGYNGVERGAKHCTESNCPRANAPSGTALDACMALHAEQNALLNLKEPDRAHTLYCTTAPCIHCIKQLSNTALERIVFLEDYPHSADSRLHWLKKPNRKWEKLND